MNYLDRHTIAKEIGNCFIKKPPEISKLYLFADKLLKILHPDEGEPIPLHHLDRSIQSYVSQRFEENFLDRDEIKKFIKKTDKFYNDFLALRRRLSERPDRFLQSAWIKYHQEKGDLIERNEKLVRQGRYDDDDNLILIFPEKMEFFEEYIKELYMMLQLELNEISVRKGRPNNRVNYSYLAHLYVMTDCLLEKSPGISSSVTPFRRIVDYCTMLIEDPISDNFPYVMSCCFEDCQTIRGMGFNYREYGRLDLFIEHVLKTKHVENIIEAFDDEWGDWEKPSNFNTLKCIKNL